MLQLKKRRRVGWSPRASFRTSAVRRRLSPPHLRVPLFSCHALGHRLGFAGPHTHSTTAVLQKRGCREHSSPTICCRTMPAQHRPVSIREIASLTDSLTTPVICFARPVHLEDASDRNGSWSSRLVVRRDYDGGGDATWHSAKGQFSSWARTQLPCNLRSTSGAVPPLLISSPCSSEDSPAPCARKRRRTRSLSVELPVVVSNYRRRPNPDTEQGTKDKGETAAAAPVDLEVICISDDEGEEGEWVSGAFER